MIKDLVQNLKSPNAELKMHCANAIFKVYDFKIFKTVFLMVFNFNSAQKIKKPEI